MGSLSMRDGEVPSVMVRRRGQAMLEYVLVFCALLGLLTALGFLVRAERRSSDRTQKLVSSQYP